METVLFYELTSLFELKRLDKPSLRKMLAENVRASPCISSSMALNYSSTLCNSIDFSIMFGSVTGVNTLTVWKKSKPNEINFTESSINKLFCI